MGEVSAFGWWQWWLDSINWTSSLLSSLLDSDFSFCRSCQRNSRKKAGMVIRYKLVISMKRYEKCVVNAKSPKGLLLAHLAPICTWKQEAHPISPLLSLHRPGQSQPKAGPLQIPLVNSSKPCVAQGHPLQTTNFLSFSSSPLLGRVRCVLVSSCSQIQIRLLTC